MALRLRMARLLYAQVIRTRRRAAVTGLPVELADAQHDALGATGHRRHRWRAAVPTRPAGWLDKGIPC
jgi:hypothetical protein